VEGTASGRDFTVQEPNEIDDNRRDLTASAMGIVIGGPIEPTDSGVIRDIELLQPLDDESQGLRWIEQVPDKGFSPHSATAEGGRPGIGRHASDRQASRFPRHRRRLPVDMFFFPYRAAQLRWIIVELDLTRLALESRQVESSLTSDERTLAA
jgi:hypothetical protein